MKISEHFYLFKTRIRKRKRRFLYLDKTETLKIRGKAVSVCLFRLRNIKQYNSPFVVPALLLFRAQTLNRLPSDNANSLFCQFNKIFAVFVPNYYIFFIYRIL